MPNTKIAIATTTEHTGMIEGTLCVRGTKVNRDAVLFTIAMRAIFVNDETSGQVFIMIGTQPNNSSTAIN